MSRIVQHKGKQTTKEWSPCFAHKLKHSERAKDWLIPNKTFKIMARVN